MNRQALDIAGTASAWYAYAVAPAGLAPPPGGILPDASVETLCRGALEVLVSRVPARLFDKADPANRTADPDWMAERISAHHAVVAAAGTCLPMAFGTLFSSAERLADWLAPRAPVLYDALEQASARTEWAVSLEEDAGAFAAWLDAHDPKLVQLARAMASAGEGAAFLIGRRRDKARAAARDAYGTRAACLIQDTLSAEGLDYLRERPCRARAAWTVMVPNGHDGIPDLSFDLPAGLTPRVTGPWPAYAYARMVLAGEASDA